MFLAQLLTPPHTVTSSAVFVKYCLDFSTGLTYNHAVSHGVEGQFKKCENCGTYCLESDMVNGAFCCAACAERFTRCQSCGNYFVTRAEERICPDCMEYGASGSSGEKDDNESGISRPAGGRQGDDGPPG